MSETTPCNYNVDLHLQADPKLAAQKDDDDRLPIHWAIANNHHAVVSTLINNRNFDPDVPDGSGWTPLMIASSLKDSEGEKTIDLLLQKDAEINAQSFSGQTALHFASSKDNLDIVRKLIKHGASPRLKDKRGQLPLHRAAAVGSVPIVKLLLENKSPLNASDIDGMTALHHAISEGHGDAALALLQAGAETDKKDMDGRLAIDAAPDSKVKSRILTRSLGPHSHIVSGPKVHRGICRERRNRHCYKLITDANAR